MQDISQRERKVDMNVLPHEDRGMILEELGKKVAEIANRTKNEINKLLKIYNYEASFDLNFHEIERIKEEPVAEKVEEPLQKKKRGRKSKKA